MEVTYFVDEAVLKFRQTWLTKENVGLNIGCLYGEVWIKCVREYFEPAYNCLYSKAWIGCVGEYFFLFLFFIFISIVLYYVQYCTCSLQAMAL